MSENQSEEHSAVIHLPENDATEDSPSIVTNSVNVPVSSGVLVVGQACEVLGSGDISCVDQALEVLTVGGDYVVLRNDNNISSSSSTTLLALPAVGNDDAVINKFGLPRKRRKIDQNSAPEDNLKQILASIHHAVLQRLDAIEKKVENVNVRCRCLEEKVENVVSQVKEAGLNSRLAFSAGKGRTGAIIVGVPPSVQTGALSSNTSNTSSSSNVQLITLNSEADFPNGSWLGDENDPEHRVRCHIHQQDLDAINKSCTTAEKLALTLLDYLFDRETQACSNISGTGKHGKKQLDPLRIYGIHCHLVHRFNIAEKDWHRIKQNLDSKCRTAFRRKQKGMPLTVKAFRDRLTPTYLHLIPGDEQGSQPSSPTSSLSNQPHQELISVSDAGDLNIDQDIGFSHAVPVSIHHADGSSVSLPSQNIAGEPQVIHTEHGPIQVVHATTEQLAHMEQTHQIQILSSAEVLRELQEQATQESASQDNS